MKITYNNRWLIILGAVIVQISIGTIYSWSLFNKPLMENFGWSENQVVLTFSIATFTFAFSTMISGKLLDRIGPRMVTTIGGVFYGGGLLLASTANSIMELYLYYGIFSGLGVGFVYVCPISTSVKWFPNKKGLITGISVGAFGLGSLVFKYIIEALLEVRGVNNTFALLGVIYLILIILGAQLLRNPDNNPKDINDLTKENQYELTTKQMIHSSKFYFIWILFYLGCISGLLIIGLASDIGVKLIGLSFETAANTVALIALFNAFGRIIWGIISDKLGRIQVVSWMFIITMLSLLALGFAPLTYLTFFIVLAGIAFCFGGFLSIFPIITEELYGKKNFGSNYGVMYQAYGGAALTGPILLRLVTSLQMIFIVLSILAFLGIIISFKLRIDNTSHFDIKS